MLQMGSDTVIDGVQYKKIEYSYSNIYNGNYHEWREPEHDFYLREDTATGRLWYRFPNFCFEDIWWSGEWEYWYEEEFRPEILLVDMSLSIGDTFVIYNFTWRQKDICTVVDTMTVNNRRTIVLQHQYDAPTTTFTEGIGCSNLFEYGLFDATGSRIRCCHKDGELVYHWQSREDDGNCIPSYVGINNRDMQSLLFIHPNPCSDRVWIDGEDIQLATLLNIKGEVLSANIDFRQSFDMSYFPQGVYIIRLVTHNAVFCRTIIKK
jgi:hypothetical protein